MSSPEAIPESYAALLKALQVVRIRARFLPVNHPSVGEAMTDLHREIARILSAYGHAAIIIQSEELFVNGTRCPTESIQFEDMVRDLTAMGVHSIAFSPGLTVSELSAGVSSYLLLHPGEERKLVAIPHVHLNEHSLSLDSVTSHFDIDAPIPMEAARDTYQAAIAAMVGSFYDSRHKASLNIGLVESMVGSLHEGVEHAPELYFAVSQLREFSEYTFFHSVNVAILSMLLGARVGLSTAQVRRLGVAAMLHDVGKAQVPIEVLNKPGRLDTSERKVMEGHPAASVQILSAQRGLHASALAVAAQHHVGFDGKGYPNFAGFGELHLFTHIVTIADVYDALRSERSYKKAMLPDRAMLIMMEGIGKTFHPALLKAFYRMVGPFPKGAVVELDSGEYGVVTKPNPRDPFRPELRMFTPGAAKGRATRLLDLSKGDTGRMILRAVDPNTLGVVAGRIV